MVRYTADYTLYLFTEIFAHLGKIIKFN
ncbi:MAG: hypothetical protein ACL7BU_00285 [Candidatus Phlomobacter fragariae]